MYAEPPDIDRGLLASTLDAVWGVRVADLRYEPVGFGSHHYVDADRRWFVTLDDLEDTDFDELDAALRTSITLARAGLEFVLAPVVADDGTFVTRLRDDYSIALFPFVDGTSYAFGEPYTEPQRHAVLEALGRLHAIAPMDEAPRASLDAYGREDLQEALDEIDTPWTGGPFSEPARAVLQATESTLRERLDEFDALARQVAAREDPCVITHGEPHSSNVIWRPDGSFLLIDWDTAAVGPRERDLWMVPPRDKWDREAYRRAAPSRDPDPLTMDFYRLHWDLSELAVYLDWFRYPHDDDANTRLAWEWLQRFATQEPAGG